MNTATRDGIPAVTNLDRQLCQYVQNTGQVPLKVVDFDDDWEPAGDMYRERLADLGLIEVAPGSEPNGEHPGTESTLMLTDAGKALAESTDELP